MAKFTAGDSMNSFTKLMFLGNLEQSLKDNPNLSKEEQSALRLLSKHLRSIELMVVTDNIVTPIYNQIVAAIPQLCEAEYNRNPPQNYFSGGDNLAKSSTKEGRSNPSQNTVDSAQASPDNVAAPDRGKKRGVRFADENVVQTFDKDLPPNTVKRHHEQAHNQATKVHSDHRQAELPKTTKFTAGDNMALLPKVSFLQSLEQSLRAKNNRSPNEQEALVILKTSKISDNTMAITNGRVNPLYKKIAETIPAFCESEYKRNPPQNDFAAFKGTNDTGTMQRQQDYKRAITSQKGNDESEVTPQSRKPQ